MRICLVSERCYVWSHMYSCRDSIVMPSSVSLVSSPFLFLACMAPYLALTSTRSSLAIFQSNWVQNYNEVQQQQIILAVFTSALREFLSIFLGFIKVALILRQRLFFSAIFYYTPTIRLSHQQLTRVLVTSQTWDATPASIGRSVPCRLGWYPSKHRQKRPV